MMPGPVAWVPTRVDGGVEVCNSARPGPKRPRSPTSAPDEAELPPPRPVTPALDPVVVAHNVAAEVRTNVGVVVQDEVKEGMKKSEKLLERVEKLMKDNHKEIVNLGHSTTRALLIPYTPTRSRSPCFQNAWSEGEQDI